MEGGGEKNKGVVVAVVKTPDKSKRDEWSEGGIMSLLDVYETKWSLRNRAKLKGSDWEEIAGQVSARNCGTKPGKTPNQCKNKIEAMKKRYRMELAVNNHSGWQFYARMDRLVKGTHCLEPKVGDVVSKWGDRDRGFASFAKFSTDNGPAHVQIVEKAQNYKTVDESGQNHVQVVKKAQNCNTIVERGQNHVQDDNQDDASDTVPNNSEFSTPRNKAARVADRSLKVNSFKRRKRSGNDMAESIRVLAHSMLKIEQARMEMYRDSERLRVEADIKRAEMDLKRTEIVAKTQLQIAKLLVKRTCNHNNKSGNSSLVGEHNVATNPEERSDTMAMPCPTLVVTDVKGNLIQHSPDAWAMQTSGFTDSHSFHSRKKSDITQIGRHPAIDISLRTPSKGSFSILVALRNVRKDPLKEGEPCSRTPVAIRGLVEMSPVDVIPIVAAQFCYHCYRTSNTTRS
ncbi:hypothetical protein HYC85_011110 [Camellia sinensis]|uniref:Myb/SANT-like DNA-binding domain-containing protein n=1 Tax=Camellia sinensis TaxID=4442 RepID=A0A7J7HMI8_CAMSI|nr:hypothetical protein HYC85_011110 [Camellia sinensis]